jgi:hypothetical protein
MIPKISLAAAFFLMVAPPMACASNRDATNPEPVTCQAHEAAAGMLVAQDDQSNADNSDNDNNNDSDSSDSADDNQNADSDQTNQQNAAGDDQQTAPQVPDAAENDSNAMSPPNAVARPLNPYQ